MVDRSPRIVVHAIRQEHRARSGTAGDVLCRRRDHLLWAVSGPLFGFSDTWQLVINTGTTIVTFLMVFLIQNTQNRDSEAIQLKLDELIRSIEGAHLALLDLEELDDKDLERICSDYRELAREARKDLRAGKSDTDVREVGDAHRKESRARSVAKGKTTD